MTGGAEGLAYRFRVRRLELGRSSVARRRTTTTCSPLAGHGSALGAQAGEARLREVVEQAGFGSFRRATRTFNLVLEAR